MTNYTLYTLVTDHSFHRLVINIYTIDTSHIPFVAHTGEKQCTVYRSDKPLHILMTNNTSYSLVINHSFPRLKTNISTINTCHKPFIAHTGDKQYTIFINHKPVTAHTGDKQYTMYTSHKLFIAQTGDKQYTIYIRHKTSTEHTGTNHTSHKLTDVKQYTV